MTGHIKNNINRIQAYIICALLLGLMLFSLCFTAAEADHDCHGEDCHICEILEICHSVSRRMSEGAAVAVIVCAFAAVPVIVMPPVGIDRAEGTLVSEKVRMND